MKNARNTTNLTSYFPYSNNSSIDFIVEMTESYPFNKNRRVLFVVINKSGTNQLVLLPEKVLIFLSELNPIKDIGQMAKSKIVIQVLDISKLQWDKAKKLDSANKRRPHISAFDVQIHLLVYI